MKKVITITPINRGKANEGIFNLVEQYNAGEVNTDKNGFIASIAIYAKLNFIILTVDQDESFATIKENGKETVLLHFKEVHALIEIDEHEADLLTEQSSYNQSQNP